jgi:hypothetical protein
MNLVQGKHMTMSLTLGITFLMMAPSLPSDPVTLDLSQQQNSKIASVLDLIDEQLLRTYLEVLVAYGPRWTGTYGCDKSAEYIFAQFSDMGLEAHYQHWKAFGNKYHPRWFESENVEGTLKSEGSTDVTIIFGAHYDSVRDAPGANDDGSGTAAVLAAAYALSHFTFARTIKFLTFSGEEEGLLGSWAYAKRAYQENENIMIYINADMIGHATQANTGAAMGFSATEDASWVVDLFGTINSQYTLQFQTLNDYTIDRDATGHSDYKPFAAYGYESVACWEGEHDPNMHTPMDDLSNVNFSYLVRTTKMIAGTLAALADYQDPPPQVQIVSPRFGTVYFEGRTLRTTDNLNIKVFDDIWVWTEVKYSSTPIDRVEFYYNNRLMYTDTEPPYKWHLNKFSIGTHRIKAVVYDELGRTSSDYRDIYYLNLFLRR